MPPISHRTLLLITVAAGLIGQFLLHTNPVPGVFLCGVALVAALIDGWWYLQPLGKMWWYPAMFGVLGLTMWREPRGWFFMAWAVIELGTSLRAERLIRRWEQQTARAMAEEEARARRLAALGYDTHVPETEQVVQAATLPPLPPIPLWRYPVALAMGAGAAWAGAWGTRIFYQVTGWQLDILALGIGYLVGKMITAGAGDRSNTSLRWAASILSVAGVLYGRYLLLAYVLFQKNGLQTQPLAILNLALTQPGRVLGLWLVIFAAAGAWAGWHYSRDPLRERLERG